MRTQLLAFLCLFLAWNIGMPIQAQQPDPEVVSLVQGNSDFALALYQRLAKEDGNLFFSPYSISNALAMTYAGAKGNTAQEMKTALRFQLDQERLHPAFAKLISQLHAEGKKRPFQLAVANRLWGQKDYGFLPSFLKIGHDSYHAGLEEVDFITATEEAHKTINTWVEKQTRDKIKNLIPPKVLTVDTRLVLTNAIYFKAAWSRPFEPRQTQTEAFHLAGGKTVQVPMMQANQSTNFANLESFSLVTIPYEEFEQSMIVLLPKKRDGLSDLEKQLTAQNLDAWVKKAFIHRVDLKLPKFKITGAFRLDEKLREMGMQDAFVPGKADFSGMATRERLNISAVLHKAFVDVNEAGTEAAAATAVVLEARSLPQPATFHADHPFVFLIRDNRSGSILFLGRVANPGS